jgi:CobQ/CobB/MinD/ParA nucleotide binding domain
MIKQITNEGTEVPGGIATVHLSLQGKGGVGKSLVASILAQYLLDRGKTVRCIDTDPVNKTLSQYRGLPTEQLKLLREGGVDQRGFDGLMEHLLTDDGAIFVVDNGASTFIPLWNYILENNVHQLLRDARRRLYVHIVITGGQALFDTLNGFSQLAESSNEQNIIVWINEYFGRVEKDGKQFSDMKVFQDNAERVFGTVGIVKRNQDTFGRDMEEMVSRKLTFSEAIRGDFSLMSKQRLKVVERDLFEQLDQLAIF